MLSEVCKLREHKKGGLNSLDAKYKPNILCTLRVCLLIKQEFGKEKCKPKLLRKHGIIRIGFIQ
jgi:hypothetical protein